jgi:hypothetical protein
MRVTCLRCTIRCEQTTDESAAAVLDLTPVYPMFPKQNVSSFSKPAAPLRPWRRAHVLGVALDTEIPGSAVRFHDLL